MLIEVKVKVARIVDEKVRRKTETYLIDREFFSEAEYAVTALMQEEEASHLIESSEIQSLRVSPVREICTQYEGSTSFIATLKDIFITDDGTEKATKYKVLLWADSLTEAMARTNVFVRQGYNMLVEGLKEVNYTYLSPSEPDENDDTTNE